MAPARLSLSAAIDDLTRHAEAAGASDKFSGVILVARNGAILRHSAWGLKDRDRQEGIEPDTRFRIGSINKAFTSVAILQLVEQGRVKLDDPLAAYLPDYPNRDLARQVTIRHLLTHSGGTGNIFGPQFEQNRLTLKTHDDYLKLYGERALGGVPG